MHLLMNLKKGKYVALKRITKDRKEWQKLKRAGSRIHLLLSRLLEEEEYSVFSEHHLSMRHSWLPHRLTVAIGFLPCR